MWKSVKYLGLLLFITSILTGCKLIVLKSYGFKLALDYNEDTQRKFEKKYKIPENSSFQLDTSFHSTSIAMQVVFRI